MIAGRIASALAAAAALLSPAWAELTGALADEAGWLAPGAARALLLTTEPAECLRTPAAEDRLAVEAGRAAFRSPFFLGGTAARAGLSCNSCHPSGRRNEHFFLEGVSGSPGSADATSSIFSAVREDHAFNPVPIPDLLGVRHRSQLGRAHPMTDLSGFVASVAGDEFQGRPPSELFSMVAAYLRHLDPQACGDRDRIERAPGRDMEAAGRALAAAALAQEAGGAAVADFLILTAQGELGRVHARFAPLPELQDDLEVLGRSLGRLRRRITEAEATSEEIAEKRARINELAIILQDRRADSLYDRDALERALVAP